MKNKTKIGWAYYNANPFDRSCGDCTIRAISKFENISWEKAYRGLFQVAIKTKGTSTEQQTIHTYLKDKCIILKTNILLKDYEAPYEKRLLLLHRKKDDAYHMVFCQNSKYYYISQLNGKEWEIIEICIPINKEE